MSIMLFHAHDREDSELCVNNVLTIDNSLMDKSNRKFVNF